jgi:hypothetical protein
MTIKKESLKELRQIFLDEYGKEVPDLELKIFAENFLDALEAIMHRYEPLTTEGRKRENAN